MPQNQQKSLQNNNRLSQVPVFLGLEAFTRIKIGVEGDSLPHQYLVGSLGGRFAENVVQFKTVHLAIDALKAGKLGAVMASRAQMEAAVGVIPKTLEMTEFSGVGMSVHEWDLGLAVKTENTELAPLWGRPCSRSRLTARCKNCLSNIASVTRNRR